MTALDWIARLATLVFCVAAPGPLAAWLGLRVRGSTSLALLGGLCSWVLLEALAVVGVGIAGPLTLGRVLAVEAVLAGGSILVLRRERPRLAELSARLRQALASCSGGERLLLAAIACAGAGATAAMVAAPSGDYDSWMYQLPQVAEWIQHASLQGRQEQWLDKQTFERGILYYPGDWTALYWLFTAPLGRDVCTLLPNLIAWTIFGLSARFLATRAGAGRVGSLGAMALAMLMPLAALNLHSAHVDLAAGAELAALLCFAINGTAEGCRASRWLALALAGLLVGTKMSGPTQLAAPLLIAAWLWRGRRRAGSGGEPPLAALAIAGCMLLGGWWYLRTWHETGNPLGFVAFSVLGHAFPGVIDRAYIERTSLLHVFRVLDWRHWALLVGSVAAFCAPVAIVIAAALPRVLGPLRSSRDARALAAVALLLAWLYAAGPWSAKHAHDPDLSWWMGQQLRYTFAFWAVVAALAAAALSERARGLLPGLAIAAAIAFPFCTYCWMVAVPAELIAAGLCWLAWRRPLPRIGDAVALAAVLVALALVPLADALRWRLLNARTDDVPAFIDATLPPAEPIAFWGSHQSWLLYGRDLRRPVRYVELERCGDAGQVAAAMRARGCAWIALGPRWRDFDSERYRLVDDHPELFALAHGQPEAWGVCLYRLREP